MKKYIFGAVLSFGILVSPAFTHATGLTGDQVQSILGLLSSLGVDQSTIDNVRTALNGGTPTSGGTQPWCHTFNTNLTIGNSGDDIDALRQALGLSGITPTTSNVFDEDTAGYVVHFQAKYGIRQTGYVGPLTRAKLNSLYGCNGQSTSVSNPNPNTANGLCPAGQTWSGPIDSGECVSVATTDISATPVTLTAITPSSGPVATSVRLDGCGSDSSSGFTLVYTGPKSGSASIPVETLGAASGCGYMTFTVPSDFPAGAYTLQVKNNQTGAMSTNSETFTVTVAGATATQTTANTSTIAAPACTTTFSPNPIKIGDFTTWNFAAGAGDTTFQYSCSSGFTKADGTIPLSYGPLPLSGAWSIKATGPLDCTLTSWNPNVTGSGSTCRAILKITAETTTTTTTGSSGACTTSFSPNPVKTGDITTWNFQSGAGDTTFQYSCSNLFTKEDGTAMLSYGSLPLGSGSWRIKSPGPLDCTLSSYNPSVTGSGSTCRAILKSY